MNRKTFFEIIGVIALLFTLFFGDNIYQQITGRSIFATKTPLALTSPPNNGPVPQETSENDGKITFLSELSPQIIEAAGDNYCVGRDPVGNPPTCTGAPIEVQGIPYPHSLFAHAASTLIFDLNEKYDTFVASIFLFGSQCGDGASFRIELDGKEVFSSPIIKHGEVPSDLRIDVRYGRTLRLETHTGSNNDYLCDGTVWGEPYLISKP